MEGYLILFTLPVALGNRYYLARLLLLVLLKCLRDGERLGVGGKGGHGERHEANICPSFRTCYHLGSTSWAGSGCSSKVLVVPLHQQRAGEQGRAPFRLVLSVLGVKTPCLGRVWGKALLCWLPWQAVLSVMLNRPPGPWEKITCSSDLGIPLLIMFSIALIALSECKSGMLPSASWINELCASGQATAALGKGSVAAHCLMHKGLLLVSFLL